MHRKWRCPASGSDSFWTGRRSWTATSMLTRRRWPSGGATAERWPSPTPSTTSKFIATSGRTPSPSASASRTWRGQTSASTSVSAATFWARTRRRWHCMVSVLHWGNPVCRLVCWYVYYSFDRLFMWIIHSYRCVDMFIILLIDCLCE